MFLYIVRHAWAGEPGDSRWPNDCDRPLTEAGRKRFHCVAKQLAKRGFCPTIVATSPYQRTRETAEILVERLGKSSELILLDELAPGAALAPLLEWVRQYPDQDVAWVGHAPDVAQLSAAMIGDCQAMLRFPKGAVVAIEFESRPDAGVGQLRWFATAKLLGC